MQNILVNGKALTAKFNTPKRSKQKEEEYTFLKIAKKDLLTFPSPSPSKQYIRPVKSWVAASRGTSPPRVKLPFPDSVSI